MWEPELAPDEDVQDTGESMCQRVPLSGGKRAGVFIGQLPPWGPGLPQGSVNVNVLEFIACSGLGRPECSGWRKFPGKEMPGMAAGGGASER